MDDNETQAIQDLLVYLENVRHCPLGLSLLLFLKTEGNCAANGSGVL